MGPLAGKIAIVTGAAQGVGRATARALAAQGAAVALVDREQRHCEATLADITQNGGRAMAIGADLSTHEGARHMVSQTLGQFGDIDVSVHNVGGAIRTKPFWEYEPNEIGAEIARSLWPTLWCCREVVPHMRSKRSGAIINIGSAATRWTHRVPYSTAKGGVHSLTVCLARELARDGVRVNCVSPGALENSDRFIPRSDSPPSEQERVWRDEAYQQSLSCTPMARLGRADEIAGAVCFLASDAASYITGQILFVAGGEIG